MMDATCNHDHYHDFREIEPSATIGLPRWKCDCGTVKIELFDGSIRYIVPEFHLYPLDYDTFLGR